MGSIPEATAFKLLTSVGVSQEKAAKLLDSLTVNEDGRYTAMDVAEMTESMAELQFTLKDLVKKYDPKKTGFISHNKAHELSQTVYPNVPGASLKAMLAKFDKDGNKKINLKELIDFFISLVIKKKSLLQRFTELDVDNSGELTDIELVDILMEALCLMFPSQAYGLVEIFDKDADGKISRDEFITMWTDLFG